MLCSDRIRKMVASPTPSLIKMLRCKLNSYSIEHNFHTSLYFLFWNLRHLMAQPYILVCSTVLPFSLNNFCSAQRFSNLKWWENLKQISVYPFLLEACVTEQVTPQTPDLKVCGSSVPHRIVFLDEELHSTLSFFNQVFKWPVPVTNCWGLVLAPAMD